MEEPKYAQGWIVVDHIIPGVTAEMLDWWWVNSCMHQFRGPPPGSSSPPHPSGKKPSGGGWRAHNIAEVSTFKVFLPALWGIWQAVPDPSINRQCSLKIEKKGAKIIYIK